MVSLSISLHSPANRLELKAPCFRLSGAAILEGPDDRKLADLVAGYWRTGKEYASSIEAHGPVVLQCEDEQGNRRATLGPFESIFIPNSLIHAESGVIARLDLGTGRWQLLRQKGTYASLVIEAAGA